MERLVQIVREKYTGCKNRNRFDEYKFKIHNGKGADREKLNRVREIALIMEVKP
jgi:hypothetical protein